MQLDPDPDPDHVTGFDRRVLVRSTALFGLGALAWGALGRRALAMPQGARVNEVLDTSCELSPTSILGPYWLNTQLMRQDITEGQAGLTLYMVLRIREQIGAKCVPVQGAIVDVWHANAPGKYSGFASMGTNGQTWLRGIQPTSASGQVIFRTIYPGWYTGRSTHVHVRVLLNQQYVLTSQLYFPDSFTGQVYQSPPYLAHGPSPTTNQTDGFYDVEMEMPVFPGQGGAYVTGKTIVIV